MKAQVIKTLPRPIPAIHIHVLYCKTTTYFLAKSFLNTLLKLDRVAPLVENHQCATSSTRQNPIIFNPSLPIANHKILDNFGFEIP